MICSTCRTEGRTSTVDECGASQTLLGHWPFFDATGVRHDHDPNTITRGYRCSNGHEWNTKELRKCPSCSYGSEK